MDLLSPYKFLTELTYSCDGRSRMALLLFPTQIRLYSLFDFWYKYYVNTYYTACLEFLYASD